MISSLYTVGDGGHTVPRVHTFAVSPPLPVSRILPTLPVHTAAHSIFPTTVFLITFCVMDGRAVCEWKCVCVCVCSKELGVSICIPINHMSSVLKGMLAVNQRRCETTTCAAKMLPQHFYSSLTFSIYKKFTIFSMSNP